MPIYEYKCLDCGAHLEKMRKVSDDPLTVCEVCGGRLEKQISLSGFQFKGEGWYVTDYSAKKADKSGKSGATEKAEKSGDGGEKSDKSEKSEKSSPAESTAKSETASNTKSESSPVKKD